MSLYMPPKFLTPEVIAAVVAEFDWPETYTFEDWRPDGIGMIFPRCTLVFYEGFESEMELQFIPENTGLNRIVTMYQVLISQGGPDTPGLLDYFSPEASPEKVRDEIRNLSTIVLHHFRSSILGDFDWVPAYREYLANRERSRPQ